MLYGEFVGSEASRRRYWARSYLGWQRIGQAYPNAGHHALVDAEKSGLVGVLTQNVDGLHAAAGSSRVIALHGEIAQVICLDCGALSDRSVIQDRLARLNPDLQHPPVTEHAELRPDGDAVVDDWHDFVLADCDATVNLATVNQRVCRGRLKPDVVFFGESVPKVRVSAAYSLVDQAEVLVVAGSSLTVMSGLRFVRHAARAGKPVVIINRGVTRGDDLATIKIDDGCSEILAQLVRSL